MYIIQQKIMVQFNKRIDNKITMKAIKNLN